MKGLLNILKGVRTFIKYAGLVLVIFDIISYAADKIESYIVKKDPKLKPEVERMQKENPLPTSEELQNDLKGEQI